MRRPASGSEDLLANQMRVSRVVRIHGDRDVAQHGLGPRRRDGDLAAAVRERVSNLPERAGLLLVFDFEVGHGGTERRIPVDQARASIDQPVFMQAYEGLDDRIRKCGIHRESLARPVARRAQPAHLTRDRRARFLLPRPDPLDEFFAPQLDPRFAFGLELIFDDDLGRDPGVVGAHLPQSVVASHAVVADQHVDERVLKRVPHVQRSGDVRRRELNAERRYAAFHRCLEKAARLPERIPLRLDGGRFKTLVELHRRVVIQRV